MAHTPNQKNREERVAEAVELLHQSEIVFKELLRDEEPQEDKYPMCKGLEESYSKSLQGCYEALAKYEGAHQIETCKMFAGLNDGQGGTDIPEEQRNYERDGMASENSPIAY